jgi:hypothetical protein
MGDVTLSIPGNAKATIVVNISSVWETDWDEIQKNVLSDFPLKSKKNGDHDVLTLTYEVNGGGSTIVIGTAEGTVHLRKNK